jgi:RNase P subunit RPR2
MEAIEYREIVITCETCGNVRRFPVHSEDDCHRIFQKFECENKCGRNLYSFITVGTLKLVEEEE